MNRRNALKAGAAAAAATCVPAVAFERLSAGAPRIWHFGIARVKPHLMIVTPIADTDDGPFYWPDQHIAGPAAAATRIAARLALCDGRGLLYCRSDPDRLQRFLQRLPACVALGYSLGRAADALGGDAYCVTRTGMTRIHNAAPILEKGKTALVFSLARFLKLKTRLRKLRLEQRLDARGDVLPA